MSKEQAIPTNELKDVIDNKNIKPNDTSNASATGKGAASGEKNKPIVSSGLPNSEKSVDKTATKMDSNADKKPDDKKSNINDKEINTKPGEKKADVKSVDKKVDDKKIADKKSAEKSNKKPKEKIAKKQPESVQPVVKKSYGGIFNFLLILLVIGAGAAASYYFWEQQKQQIITLKKQSGEIQKQVGEIKKQSSLINQQHQSISDLQMQIENTIANFRSNTELSNDNATQLNKLQDKIQRTEDISQQAIAIVNRGQREWALSEINYLLRMAHQRLIVAKDINGAIAALKGADERIGELGDLTFFKVREQLAIDIGRLSAVQKADINGISLSLDQAIASLPDLPFISAKEEIKELLQEEEMIPISVEKKSIVDTIIEAVKKIGGIKFHKRSIQTANNVDQQVNIEQLLRTHLLAARLAALQLEQTQFIYEIKQAEKVLDLNYDTNDNRIQQLQKTLADFSFTQLNPDLPELTKAWSLLQVEVQKLQMPGMTEEYKKAEE